MKLAAIAADYDGTIAVEGALDPAVREAIGAARQQGIAVILVTGRRLADLRRPAIWAASTSWWARTAPCSTFPRAAATSLSATRPIAPSLMSFSGEACRS